MNRIKEERESRGWTRKELACQLSVTQNSVYNWETGSPIAQENLIKLRDVFECDVDWLLGLTDTRTEIS